ncbi:scale keratin-like [Lacerta agilis]|uniref:scale keratin-like n=1 Tax=Lacerta agilis TaxID=80427 RepID=UPI0014198A01|nr:scale keratin-like [Lacerta agilis]
MANCGPSCAVPSCASTPVVGFGSAGLGGFGGLGGLGGLGLGNTYGYGSGALVGSGIPSASLGILSGVAPSCINQIPPAEVVIQPPACVVTIPGPILSASCEPVAVGGNAPCSPGGLGSGFLGAGSLGAGALGAGALGGSRFGLGSRYGYVGRRGSICYTPC